MPITHDLAASFLAEAISKGTSYRKLKNYLETWRLVFQLAELKPPWGEDVTDPHMVMWGHFRKADPVRSVIGLPAASSDEDLPPAPVKPERTLRRPEPKHEIPKAAATKRIDLSPASGVHKPESPPKDSAEQKAKAKTTKGKAAQWDEEDLYTKAMHDFKDGGARRVRLMALARESMAEYELMTSAKSCGAV